MHIYYASRHCAITLWNKIMLLFPVQVWRKSVQVIFTQCWNYVHVFNTTLTLHDFNLYKMFTQSHTHTHSDTHKLWSMYITFWWNLTFKWRNPNPQACTFIQPPTVHTHTHTQAVWEFLWSIPAVQIYRTLPNTHTYALTGRYETLRVLKMLSQSQWIWTQTHTRVVKSLLIPHTLSRTNLILQILSAFHENANNEKKMYCVKKKTIWDF
jgi:hypothetical protein